MNFGSITTQFTKMKHVHPIVSFFKINISDKLSLDPLYRFSLTFHHMGGIWSWINNNNNNIHICIAPYGRNFRGAGSGLLFSITHGMLPWQHQFCKGKIGEIGLYWPLFVALAFRNGLQYRQFHIKKAICDDLATLCVCLVNFDPVSLEFKKGKDLHLSSIDQQFGYAAPLLDLAVISMPPEFSGAITTQFSFTYTLKGVTAMPRGYTLGSAVL